VTLKRFVFGLVLAAVLVASSRASAGPLGVDYFVNLAFCKDE